MKNDDDGGDDLMSTVVHNICAWKRSEGICIPSDSTEYGYVIFMNKAIKRLL